MMSGGYHPKFNPAGDIISGMIMATTSIPQLIAYAESVGYSSYRGLSTAGIPLFVWGVLTGHPYMNIGVTSLTAIITKADLHGDEYIHQHGESAYIELIAVYTLFIGVATVLLAITGVGTLASRIPKSVRSGSKYGTSIGVLLSAIPNGFLLHGSNDLKVALSSNPLYQQYIMSRPYLQSTFPGLVAITQSFVCLCHPLSIWDIEPTVMFVAGTAFVMYNGAKYIKLIPKFLSMPGIEVILVTAFAVVYSVCSDYKGSIVGTIPETDSNNSIKLWNDRIAIPVDFVLTDWDQVKALVPVVIDQVASGSYVQFGIKVFMFAGVSFIGLTGLASAFEVEDNIPWNPSRELIALGITNGVAAVVGSAPIGASLSRSLVSRMTGTTSQLACIVTAFCWVYLLPYMSPFLTPIPKAALSSIMVSAVLGGIAYPKELLAFHKDGIEYTIVAWGTALLTATTSPTEGFAYGLILYFTVMFLFQQRRPKLLHEIENASSKEKSS